MRSYDAALATDLVDALRSIPHTEAVRFQNTAIARTEDVSAVVCVHLGRSYLFVVVGDTDAGESEAVKMLRHHWNDAGAKVVLVQSKMDALHALLDV